MSIAESGCIHLKVQIRLVAISKKNHGMLTTKQCTIETFDQCIENMYPDKSIRHHARLDPRIDQIAKCSDYSGMDRDYCERKTFFMDLKSEPSHPRVQTSGYSEK